jgi:hypothetical protein
MDKKLKTSRQHRKRIWQKETLASVARKAGKSFSNLSKTFDKLELLNPPKHKEGALKPTCFNCEYAVKWDSYFEACNKGYVPTGIKCGSHKFYF